MKKETLPMISTIMPVYNGARYISEAIDSILAQDYPNTEIVVIDDGSTDDTRNVVARYLPTVRYVLQEHSGIAAAMNNGVSHANGSFLSFLDSDDYWLPGKTGKQLQILQKDPNLDMVFSHVKQFYSPDLSEAQKRMYYFPDEITPGIHSGAMLIRRSSFFNVGLFDEKWEKGIFSDWYLRACEKGLHSLMLPDVFYMRRVHDANHGIVNRDKAVDYVRILKAALDRRRASKNENE